MKTEVVSCQVCGSIKPELVGSGFDTEFQTSGDLWNTFLCKECGHFYLCPRPLIEESSVIYPKDYYPALATNSSSEKVIAKIRQYIDAHKFKFFLNASHNSPCVVDIGCGDGRLLAVLKNNLPRDSELIGLDFSIDPKTKNYFENLGIKFIPGLIEDVDLKRYNISADMVLMTQVIEHLWDPNQVLKNIHKILKTGGYLFIETPNPESFCRRVQGGVFWGGWHRPRHLNIFTKNSMLNLAGANGYELLSYKQITVPAFWIMGIRNYFEIPTKDDSTFFSKLFSLKSVWALTIFTFIEFLSGIFFLGQSNHQFVLIKKT